MLDRRRMVLLLMAVLATSACHRGASDTNVDAEPRPFVGWIREIRSNMLVLEEESTSPRRAEILVMPATEIVAVSGALVPLSTLRLRQRVSVWFRGDVTESSGILTASAGRMLVYY